LRRQAQIPSAVCNADKTWETVHGASETTGGPVTLKNEGVVGDRGPKHPKNPVPRRRHGGSRFLMTIAIVSQGAIAVSALRAEDRAVSTFDHRHSGWTAILSRFVQDGQVDYAGIKSGALPELGRYLSDLGSVRRADYEAWTREQMLAFWINAYNAATVKLILDHYPLTSIRSIGLLPGAAFRTAVLKVPAYRESELSLNDIEHEILRARFHEPRIHFAIVCASESCPKLRSEAYRAETLDAQLEEAARGFARDPSKNRYDAASRVLKLSSIFKWFREDFEAEPGSLPAFFGRYADPATAKAVASGGVTVEFLDYDWTLNGRNP
jgi:hypothetical protein